MAVLLHECDRVSVGVYFVFQVAFIAHEDDWQFLCVLNLLVPVLCVVKADLSSQISAENHSVQWFEIRPHDGPHAFLACSVEHFHLNDLAAVYLKPHILNVSADGLGFNRAQLEVFVQEFVHQARFTDIAVADDADLNRGDVLFLVDSSENVVPEVTRS